MNPFSKFFNRCQAACGQNKVLAAVAAWQKSVWYPAVYAALGVLSCSFGMAAYIPIYYIFFLLTLFSALFCDDVKVLLVPLLISYFAAGGDGALNYGQAVNDVTLFFHPAGLTNMYIVGALMVAAILFRLLADGTLRTVFTRRGLLTTGLLILAGAMFLNGALSAQWEPLDLAIGAFQALGLLLVYSVILAMSERSEKIAGYVLRLCLIVGLMICAEELLLMAKLAGEGKLLELDSSGNWTGGFVRNYQVLGWGVSTLAASMLAILIAPTMALAYSARRGILYYVAALFMFFVIVLLNARTAMLMGAIVLLIGMILCCFGPNRRQNRIFFAFLAAAGVLFVVAVWIKMGTGDFFAFVANMLRFSQGSNYRFERWLNGWLDFLSAPLFGVGFMDGAATDPFVYSNMYHNIAVEILGAAGLVGAAGLIIHVKQVVELCARRFRIERVLLLLGVLAVYLTSLLDNFFFYFNVQLFYGAFLALAELSLEKTRRELLADHKRVPAGRKPRVVFTFIEAGMGHIIPERAVAEVFERKYGDKVEVIRSSFFGETGNQSMKDLEYSFVKPVEVFSRHPFYGKVAMFGNTLFGDSIAQWFVIWARGPHSFRPSVAHMRDLDADLVFTTHWATTYYILNMKKDRPYTVMFCPDCYTNGMFNMDCNDFLIPTREGLAAANRLRMYAGGHGRAVRYPIRSDAFALRGRRAEIRKKLGIPEDRLTVIFADGGYGAAKLEKTVRALADSPVEMTLIAVCGKNEEGAERLRGLAHSDKVDLRVYGFVENMLELVCASDLFVGKSGANSMIEPTFFGLPILITNCNTPIEINIKKYYTRIIGNALYIPSATRAAAAIRYFAEHREELAQLAGRARRFYKQCGAEEIADLLYERAMSLCEEPTESGAAEGGTALGEPAGAEGAAHSFEGVSESVSASGTEVSEEAAAEDATAEDATVASAEDEGNKTE